MLKTLETQVTYIPKSLLIPDERYQFHLPSLKKVEWIRHSLSKMGQTTPFLLQKAGDQYHIIDGHRRFEAISQIEKEGGPWDKVLAAVLSETETPPLTLFSALWEKNLSPDSAYGLYERACFYKRFFDWGVHVKDMAHATATSYRSVEDHIELAATKRPLAELLNESSLDPTLALMLHHRYEAWIQSPYEPCALNVVQILLEHAQRERCTTTSWRFLLDFYWNKYRPFLSWRAPQR